MLGGQMNFEELIKEQQYLNNLNILESMKPDEEIVFKTPDCKVVIRNIEKKIFDCKISKNRFARYLKIKELAAQIGIGFLADKYECKWIDNDPLPWVPIYE